MATAKFSGLALQLGRFAPDGHPAADGELLARFVATRDEPAFAELVRRYGRLVFAVCRRVTGSHHLAEDAFQAVFVVLAAKAACVRPAAALPARLHAVATRTALRARTVADRRRRRETPVESLPDAAEREGAPAADADLAAVVDEEIARLPDALRAAVVLCEMEGCSRKDAAARLGVPEGTVSSRLAAARKALAARLRSRGIALNAAGLSAALGSHATARVPAALTARALASALSPGVVPAAVAALSTGVLRIMFAQKLKAVLALATVALAALACAAVAASHDPPPEPAGTPVPRPVAARAQEKKAPAPKPAGPGTLLLARQSGLIALTPEGKEGDEYTAPKDTQTSFDGRLSPDGTRVAYLVTEDGPPRTEPPEAWPVKLVIHKFGAKEPVIVDVPARQVGLTWTADGTRVVVTKRTGDKLEGVENLLIDPTTGKTEPLALPEGSWVLDCGRDGKTFLVVHWDGKKGRLGLAAKGDKEVRVLTDLKGWTGRHDGRLSPDGKRVLYTDADPKEKDANKWGRSAKPYLLDVATKTPITA